MDSDHLYCSSNRVIKINEDVSGRVSDTNERNENYIRNISLDNI
jgi:hypothetical protein